MTDLNQLQILRIVCKADLPDLNWLVKPGEAVQYFRRVDVPIRTEWHKQWQPISSAEAYEMARKKARDCY